MIVSSWSANMAYPIKTCSICGEEFELKPNKPGFANRCPDCSEQHENASGKKSAQGAGEGGDAELNAARRKAMRDLLYRKDS
jgi:DNA-directed RNA polymerase subunit RPC12/RpoP